MYSLERKDENSKQKYIQGLTILKNTLAEGNFLSNFFQEEYRQKFNEDPWIDQNEFSFDNDIIQGLSQADEIKELSYSFLNDKGVLDTDEEEKDTNNGASQMDLTSFDDLSSIVSFSENKDYKPDFFNFFNIMKVSNQAPKEAIKEVEKTLEADRDFLNTNIWPKQIISEICLMIAATYLNAYKKEKAYEWLQKACDQGCSLSTNFQRILRNMMGEIGKENYKIREGYLTKNSNGPKGLLYETNIFSADTNIIRLLLYLEHDNNWEATAKKDLEALKNILTGPINNYLKIKIYFALIEFYLKKKDKKEAKECLKKVEDIIKAYPKGQESYLYGISQYYKAEVYLLSNSLKAKIEAEINLKHAIDICRKTLPYENDLILKYEARQNELFNNSNQVCSFSTKE